MQIRCGRATVIGETLSRRHLFEGDVDENHCPPRADGKVESRRYQPLARKPAFRWFWLHCAERVKRIYR